jgi:hypothetical protein
MNTQPTPETNAATLRATDIYGNGAVRVQVAERLQRERDEAREELAALTAQRDRLAVALANLVKANETWNQGMMDFIGRPPNWNDSYLNEAKEALQSLTQNAGGMARELAAQDSESPTNVNG